MRGNDQRLLQTAAVRSENIPFSKCHWPMGEIAERGRGAERAGSSPLSARFRHSSSPRTKEGARHVTCTDVPGSWDVSPTQACDKRLRTAAIEITSQTEI